MSSTPTIRDAVLRHMRKNLLDNRKTARLSGITEATISRIVSNPDYVPSAQTLELLATKAFGLTKAADIWLDPFAPTPHPTAPEERRPIDMVGLENDPNLRINGQPLTDEQRQAYRHLIEVLRLSRR